MKSESEKKKKREKEKGEQGMRVSKKQSRGRSACRNTVDGHRHDTYATNWQLLQVQGAGTENGPWVGEKERERA